jgi:hypothetical protein
MSFILAHADPGGVIPRVPERPATAGSNWLRGAAILVNGSGEFAECGADPAAIAGFAENNFGTTSSSIFNPFGKDGFPPGYAQVAAAFHRYFRCRYIGTLPGAVGGTYGITRDTDLLWKTDFSKSAANQRVKLIRFLTTSPENLPEVVVTVLDANVQQF